MSEIKIGRARLATAGEIPTHYAIDDIKNGEAVVVIPEDGYVIGIDWARGKDYSVVGVRHLPRKLIVHSFDAHTHVIRPRIIERDESDFWWVMCLILLVIGVIVVFLFPFIQHLTNTLL